MLPVGTQVCLQNLKTNSDLNGRIASIINTQINTKTERVGVEVNGKKILVKPECVKTMNGTSLDQLNAAIDDLETSDDMQLYKFARAFKHGNLEAALQNSVAWTKSNMSG